MNRLLAVLLALLIAGYTPRDDAVSSDLLAAPPQDASDPIAEATAAVSWQSHEGAVTFLDFAPADDRLVLAIETERGRPKRQVVVLNIADAQETFRCEALFPTVISFSPDGSRLAVLAANALTLHDLTSKQVVLHVDRTALGRDISALGFTADGKTLVGAAE